MINFYNHHNQFILPLAANKKPCGETYAYYLKKWNCNISIPFSSFHKYIREDSVKMNKFVTPLESHYENFDDNNGELFPAFIRWDSEKNDYIKIETNENLTEVKSPKFFGDNYSDQLDKNDENVVSSYF